MESATVVVVQCVTNYVGDLSERLELSEGGSFVLSFVDFYVHELVWHFLLSADFCDESDEGSYSMTVYLDNHCCCVCR